MGFTNPGVGIVVTYCYSETTARQRKRIISCVYLNSIHVTITENLDSEGIEGKGR